MLAIEPNFINDVQIIFCLIYALLLFILHLGHFIKLINHFHIIICLKYAPLLYLLYLGHFTSDFHTTLCLNTNAPLLFIVHMGKNVWYKYARNNSSVTWFTGINSNFQFLTFILCLNSTLLCKTSTYSLQVNLNSSTSSRQGEASFAMQKMACPGLNLQLRITRALQRGQYTPTGLDL